MSEANESLIIEELMGIMRIGGFEGRKGDYGRFERGKPPNLQIILPKPPIPLKILVLSKFMVCFARIWGLPTIYRAVNGPSPPIRWLLSEAKGPFDGRRKEDLGTIK